MKVVILAGGMQSTISNEREGIPKPMVEIGGKPLLWHIMKHFSEYGLTEFIVCGGYKVDTIKEYFMDFYIYESDITVDLKNNFIEVHKNRSEEWKVTVVDTGLFSATGQRVSMIEKYVEDDFLVTYGDCLTDIDVRALLETHFREGMLATIAMVKPSGRKRLLPIDSKGKLNFDESSKKENDNAWINGDCFVFSKKVFNYLSGNYDLEKQLFKRLTDIQQIALYRHYGYWMAVETKRDLVEAENLWNAGIAPWVKA